MWLLSFQNRHEKTPYPCGNCENRQREESLRKPEARLSCFRTGGWIQNSKESPKQINPNTTIFPSMITGLVMLIAALVLLY